MKILFLGLSLILTFSALAKKKVRRPVKIDNTAYISFDKNSLEFAIENDADKSEVITVSPNLGSFITLGGSYKGLGIAYSFPQDKAEDPKLDKSDGQIFFFNYAWEPLELSLYYQDIKGFFSREDPNNIVQHPTIKARQIHGELVYYLEKKYRNGSRGNYLKWYAKKARKTNGFFVDSSSFLSAFVDSFQIQNLYQLRGSYLAEGNNQAATKILFNNSKIHSIGVNVGGAIYMGIGDFFFEPALALGPVYRKYKLEGDNPISSSKLGSKFRVYATLGAHAGDFLIGIHSQNTNLSYKLAGQNINQKILDYKFFIKYLF